LRCGTDGGGGGTPGGNDGSIQFNNAGSFGGSSVFQLLSDNVHIANDLFINGAQINLGNGIATTTLTGAGGNLGIGTTTPGAGLAVSATSTLLDGILNVQDHIKTGDIIATGTITTDAITPFAGASGTTTFTGGITAAGLESTNGFRVNAGEAYFDEFVGIGTLSPTSELTVLGNGADILLQSTTDSNSRLLLENDSSEQASIGVSRSGAATAGMLAISNQGRDVIFTSIGNIGITTTTPGSLLSVQGHANVGSLVSESNIKTGNIIATGTITADSITFTGSGTTTFAGVTSTNGLAATAGGLHVSGGEAYFDERVGINTVSPGARLEIQETATDAIVYLHRNQHQFAN